MIEYERKAVVRTRETVDIIRSQVLCGDDEYIASERGDSLRSGAAGPSSEVLSEREKRQKTYRDSIPSTGVVGPVDKYHKRRSVQVFGEKQG